MFVIETAFTVLAAPLIGVAVASRRSRLSEHLTCGGAKKDALRRAWAAAWPLAVGVTGFVLASAILVLAFPGDPDNVFSLVAVSHTTLWAASLALAALGAVCASTFSDPLDAAACSVGVALLTATGVLVVGPAVAEAPTGAINAALVASPIVATASAANIDILRTDVLYRLSPLAHIRFDYPAWHSAFACYVVFALACFLAMTVNFNRRGRTFPAERISP